MHINGCFKKPAKCRTTKQAYRIQKPVKKNVIKKFLAEDKEPIENSTAPMSANKWILHTSFPGIRD